MNKPKIVRAPEGCADWLTAGKDYEIVECFDFNGDEWSFSIIDDTGDKIFPCEKNSAHLKFEDWIIVEREQTKQ